MRERWRKERGKDKEGNQQKNHSSTEATKKIEEPKRWHGYKQATNRKDKSNKKTN